MKKTTKKRKIHGTSVLPRLAVYMSNRYMYTQVVDDEKGITIIGASEKQLTTDAKKIEKARALGALIAKKALEKKIDRVVFDRGRKAYHGKIKAVAEGAREGGLQF